MGIQMKVFMDQPEGYMVKGKNRMVYKLKKLVYELEQAS